MDLWAAARAAWAGARASGALQPIATRLHHIEDGGLRFQVRVVTSRDHKLEARARQSLHEQAAGRRIDPFLPYHPAMFVADLAPAHVALLNRFPVLDHHLLVVTRAFEEQESLLSAADFTALAQCMRAIPGLAFYNAGPQAGASQAHKHLQLVPLRGTGGAVPIEALLEPAPAGQVVRMPRIPFAHACMRPALDWRAPAAQLGAQLHTACTAVLVALGIGADEAGHQSAPYNLLLTRDWLLAVPRTAQRLDRIWVNAVGFAGALLVRDTRALEELRAIGPMRVLCQLSRPLSGPP